ncbi:MAG: prepilin-type N-terminal cleavage/methylation domain-containing protein [Desulfobacterales bacterium]|nr:prepilin-type N-terminal cleavage/methylation domain-containing protein [Desulfobacterales bacterium]
MNYLSQNRNIKNGFTLLEVVVALAILGVGLMVIIELFAGGLRLGRVSEEYTKAVNYSRMKLEELALKPPAEEGVEEGEFNETYRWKIETKRIDLLPFERDTDFKPPVEFFHVKIDVIWKSGLKERSVGLESYRTIKLKSDEKKSQIPII